jgi:hypothetical protein
MSSNVLGAENTETLEQKFFHALSVATNQVVINENIFLAKNSKN